MKKILILLIFAMAILSTGWREPGIPSAISDIDIVRTDSVVELSFKLETHRSPALRNSSLLYIPRISDGEYTVSFNPLLIQSRRGEISRDRVIWVAGGSAAVPEPLRARTGSVYHYTASVPFQQWMHGSTVHMEVVTTVCGQTEKESFMLTGTVLPVVTTEPEVEIHDPIAIPQRRTIADSIAEVFSFVLPSSKLEKTDPDNFYDDERENSITIYFRINSFDIDPEYAGNRQHLINLTGTIDIIRESREADVSRIVVAGFASPDGSFAVNDRLAWERAVSVKEYIMNNTGLEDSLISIYNGSADWQGLRLLVDGDRTMPGRGEVLDIIDNYPIWDAAAQSGRMGRIMQLRQGEVYRYMADNIFPRLRNGTFIRVYYDNTKDQ